MVPHRAQGGRHVPLRGETCIVLPEGRGWETTIDEGEPLRRFAFAWRIRGAPTRVAYDLEDDGPDATRLRVRHEGVPLKESTCGTVQDAWRTCLGNLKSTAEGRSDSVRPDHAPVASRELFLSNLVDAPPSRVYAALTSADQVDAWSTGGVPRGRARVEPEVSGAFALGLEDGPDRILELVPDARLALRWPRPLGDLRVEFTLEPKSSGTAVYLKSTGYGPDEASEILRHRGAWSERLVCLKNLVEGGEAGFLNVYGDQVQER